MVGIRKALAVGIAYLSCVALALTGQQIAADLQAFLSSGSSVYLPSDPDYAENTTTRWDVYAPPTYVVAVKPALIEDIQKVVQYARKNKVPFLATGRGHGYTTTLSALQNGLELDMGNFHTITINSTTNIMTIDGSVGSDDVSAALQAAGKELPVGQCPCVGMTGYTLGGGIGPYSGLYGPTSDSVLSIEMVTGTGQFLTVSETQNANLFWGMRGAGFNYGVVTSVTYNVHNATNGGQAMNADMTFLGSQNDSVWAAAQSFVGKQPKELSITFSVSYNATLGKIIIVGNFIYAGSPEVGKELIQPFLALEPFNVNVSLIAWKDIPSSALYGATAQGCSASGIEYVPYSLNLYQIDVDNMISFVNFMNASMATEPEIQTAVVALAQYSSYGFHQHADSSSAFPHRGAVIFAQIDGFALQSSATSALNQWGRQVRDRLQRGSGKPSLEVYVHFAHGDEGPTAWYTGSKLLQLRALKAKYDPNTLFSFYNAVSSSSGTY